MKVIPCEQWFMACFSCTKYNGHNTIFWSPACCCLKGIRVWHHFDDFDLAQIENKNSCKLKLMPYFTSTCTIMVRLDFVFRLWFYSTAYTRWITVSIHHRKCYWRTTFKDYLNCTTFSCILFPFFNSLIGSTCIKMTFQNCHQVRW